VRTLNARGRDLGRALPVRVRKLDLTQFLSLPARSDSLKTGEISFVYGDCPRCGRAHDLCFRPLTRPIETNGTKQFTHWALWPASSEPLLFTYLMGTVLAEDQ
jgi:hypothetical protein